MHFISTLKYLAQRYVHDLERNWKNSACVGFKNFVNL